MSAGLSGDQSLKSVDRALGKLQTELPTDAVTLVMDGTIEDAASALSQTGIVVGFDPDLGGARVRGRFINRPVGEVLQSIATQLSLSARVVVRPGPSYYIGQPGADDIAIAVLNVPEGEADRWRGVYEVALSSNGRIAVYGDRVVVRDEEPALRRIADLHKDLIAGRPQYVVQVCFVELSWFAAQVFGVDWDLSGGFDVRLSWSDADLSDAFVRIGAALEARDQAGAVRVVNTMTLHCVEGGTASQQSGETIPIIRRQVFENGGVRDVGFDNIDTGTLLSVQVRSAGEAGVSVSIEPEISAVARFVNDLPVVARKRLSSTSVMKVGGVIVVGGLDVDSDGSERRGLPGVKYVDRQRRDQLRSKLFMFVRVKEVVNG